MFNVEINTKTIIRRIFFFFPFFLEGIWWGIPQREIVCVLPVSASFLLTFLSLFQMRREEREVETLLGGCLFVGLLPGGYTYRITEQIYDQWQFAFRRPSEAKKNGNENRGLDPIPLLLFSLKVFETNSRVAKLKMKMDRVTKLDHNESRPKGQTTNTHTNSRIFQSPVLLSVSFNKIRLISRACRELRRGKVIRHFHPREPSLVSYFLFVSFFSSARRSKDMPVWGEAVVRSSYSSSSSSSSRRKNIQDTQFERESKAFHPLRVGRSVGLCATHVHTIRCGD